MTFAAMAMDGSTEMELTGRRIEKVNKELHAPGIAKSGIGRYLLSFFDSLSIRLLVKIAADFKDDAIWFKGVAATVWSENRDVREYQHVLVPRLETLKQSLLKTREEMMRYQAKSESVKLIHVTGLAIAAATDLFEAVEAFRWTLMELEANHSDRKEGWSADTPEGVSAMFARLTQDA